MVDGNRIKELRKELNLSQTDLANILGVTAVTVSRYEGGRDPGTEVLMKLAKIFNVTVDYLTGFTDSRYPAAKISGDEITDMLATIFASMLKPRLDKARCIDNDESKAWKPSTQKAVEEGIDHIDCFVTSSSILSYVYDTIGAIGENIDFCLDNKDKWLYEKDGHHFYFSSIENKLLDERYYYKMKLQKASSFVTQEIMEVMKNKCPDQQKTPDQSESVQTDDGKQE